jgi:polyphosphate kinase
VKTDPFQSQHFINRELSWLEFNQRVLEEAMDPNHPLLERLKFFCITSSNLDEFFEVRVAGLKQQIETGTAERSDDGLTPADLFSAIVQRVRKMVADQYRYWQRSLMPALAKNGLRILRIAELDAADLKWVEGYYRTEIRPVLTPLAIDPAHPFPQLLNKSLNLIIRLELQKHGEALKHMAVVQIPRNQPRLVPLPRTDGRRDYVYLGELIGYYLADLFPGTTLLGYWHFRVTRNSELYIDEEETSNLLKAVETELHNRRKGDAVRLEVDDHMPEPIRDALLRTFRLSADDLYRVHGPLSPGGLMMLYEGDHSPDLRDARFVAPISASLRQEDVFETIRQRDILLHHPYESFSSVVGFLEQAAEDPHVLAIKQTLYRTGGDTRIIGALMRAVGNGKQVTAVVELRARFDEANNIEWARQLEEAGVHVVYGLVGYKIHAKIALVVRAEAGLIRRYVHLSTGNYNPSTARLYTDIGFLTCRPDFGEDATNLFNLLTGICQFRPLKKLMVAPFDLHEKLMQRIHRETRNAEEGSPARIILKMNSLVERQVIGALYAASRAGVKIDLVVRGICCLRPGIKGLSENITVRSIVDRYLEHSRIFYFENGCRPELYLSSADWMPRNLFRRIEVAFPVEDGNLRERLIGEMLATTLADNTKTRFLQTDGIYRKPKLSRDAPPRRSQSEFIVLAGLEEPGAPLPANGRSRYPAMKLARSPFGAAGK